MSSICSRGDLLGGQDVVQFVIGDIAALLGELDHPLDGGIGQVEKRAVLAAEPRPRVALVLLVRLSSPCPVVSSLSRLAAACIVTPSGRLGPSASIRRASSCHPDSEAATSEVTLPRASFRSTPRLVASYTRRPGLKPFSPAGRSRVPMERFDTEHHAHRAAASSREVPNPLDRRLLTLDRGNLQPDIGQIRAKLSSSRPRAPAPPSAISAPYVASASCDARSRHGARPCSTSARVGIRPRPTSGRRGAPPTQPARAAGRAQRAQSSREIRCARRSPVGGAVDQRAAQAVGVGDCRTRSPPGPRMAGRAAPDARRRRQDQGFPARNGGR